MRKFAALALGTLTLALIAPSAHAYEYCGVGYESWANVLHGPSFGSYNVTLPPGATARMSHYDISGANEVAGLIGVRENGGPWGFSAGRNDVSTVPSQGVYLTTPYTTLVHRTPKTERSLPGFEIRFLPAGTTRQIEVLTILGVNDRSAPAILDVCHTPDAIVPQPTWGSAKFATLTDVRGLGAGVDNTMTPTMWIAEGKVSFTINKSFVGRYWADPTLGGDIRLSSPAGNGRTNFADFDRSAPGTYTWTVRDFVGDGRSFFIMGADLAK